MSNKKIPHDAVGGPHLVPGNHEMRGTRRGVAICSFPCDWFDRRYAREFEVDPSLKADWQHIEADLLDAVRRGDSAAEAAAWQRALAFQSRVEQAARNYNTTLGHARSAFSSPGNSGVATRLTAIETNLTAIGVQHHAEVLNDVAKLQQSGKVRGFEDWVAESFTRSGDRLKDKVTEMYEIRRLAREYAADPAVELEFVKANPAHSNFDIHVVRNTPNGPQIERRIDVVRLQAPPADVPALTEKARHGADKLHGSPPVPGSSAETTVQIKWPPPDASNVHYTRDLKRVRSWPGGSATIDFVSEAVINVNGKSQLRGLARITFVGEAGDPWFVLVNDPVGGSNWRLLWRRP